MDRPSPHSDNDETILTRLSVSCSFHMPIVDNLLCTIYVGTTSWLLPVGSMGGWVACSIKQPARIGVHEERKVASIVASEVRSKYRYQSENE